MVENKRYPFENLVFEGGGVLGTAYAGVYKVLKERGIADNIKRVCGTSAGSISAVMIALGYSWQEAEEILIHAPFNTFNDGGLFQHFRMLKVYGWYSGDHMLDFFRKLVKDKTQDPDTTFAQLESDIDVRLISTNLTKNTSVKFSKHENSHVSIAKAMRISSSVPLFFAAQKFEDDIYVDGGVLRNYAIDEFDEDCNNQLIKTLGLYLFNPPENPKPITNIFNFTEHFLEAMKNQQHSELKNNEKDCKRTVFINDLEISALDFDINTEEREALIEQGRIATENYLDKWEAWE